MTYVDQLWERIEAIPQGNEGYKISDRLRARLAEDGRWGRVAEVADMVRATGRWNFIMSWLEALDAGNQDAIRLLNATPYAI